MLQSNPAPAAVAEPGGQRRGVTAWCWSRDPRCGDYSPSGRIISVKERKGEGQGKIPLPALRRGLREVRAGGSAAHAEKCL